MPFSFTAFFGSCNLLKYLFISVGKTWLHLTGHYATHVEMISFPRGGAREQRLEYCKHPDLDLPNVPYVRSAVHYGVMCNL